MLSLESESSRRCSRCGVLKDAAEFNVSARLGRQYYCRKCQSAWYKENKAEHIANVNANSTRYRERNRGYLIAYLRTHPCVDCGESDVALLEFDHQRDKLKTVSNLSWASVPVERLKAEIDKCEVRCANCHMRRTAQQFGWRKAVDAGNDEMFEMRG